eukprot:scaffold134_cov111-Isochrysis_galbana.AAC.2
MEPPADGAGAPPGSRHKTHTILRSFVFGARAALGGGGRELPPVTDGRYRAARVRRVRGGGRGVGRGPRRLAERRRHRHLGDAGEQGDAHAARRRERRSSLSRSSRAVRPVRGKHAPGPSVACLIARWVAGVRSVSCWPTRSPATGWKT